MKWFGDPVRWPSLRRAVVALLGVGAIWLLFEFVIGDAQLFLDYLKILAWPLVVLAALSFFRAPLEDRFRHLMRIEGPGVSAEFSAAAQGRLLQHDIEDDVDSLLGGGPHEAAEDPALNAPDDPDADDGSAPVQGGEPAGAAAALEPTRPGSLEAEGSDPSGAIAVEDFLQLLKAFRVPRDVVDEALRGAASSDDQKESLKRLLRAEAMRLRRLEKQAAERSRETRESLEAVIQKSASWGYDMGKAGAPKAVPDVEWNADGTWRITTEVPAAKPAGRQPEPSRSIDTRQIRATDRHRQIKAFEDEIKDLERKRHSPFGGSGLSAFANDNWLEELKSRLRSIDPTNPWAD